MRKVAGLLFVVILMPGFEVALRKANAQTCVQADLTHPNSVALVWTDNSTDETGFVLERKQDSAPYAVLAAAVAANMTSFTDSTVKRGAVPVTYTYRIKAYRDVDKASSPYSNESCITFAPAALPAVPAPSGLTLSRGESTGSIQASWEDTPNETQYKLVFVGKSPPREVVAWPVQDATTFTQSGLGKAKTFCGTIYAMAGTVESPPSVKSCATTPK